MNTLLDLVENFNDFEAKNDLFDFEIEGVKIWKYIRFGVFQKIVDAKYNIEFQHYSPNVTVFNKLNSFLLNTPDAILKNPFFNIPSSDILVLNHPRRISNDGVMDCQYTDTILKNTDYTFQVFEAPYFQNHLKPAGTKNLKYLDLLILKSQLKIKVRKLLNPVKENKYLQELFKELSHRYGVELSFFISNSNSIIYMHHSLFDSIVKILKQVQPKIILEVVWGKALHILFNEIAQESGIKVVELQHGIIGNCNISYNFQNKFHFFGFPDYILLFGNYWKTNAKFPIENDHLIPVGFPYFEKIQSKYSAVSIKQNPLIILILSQPTIGVELSLFAVELNKMIDRNRYKIIFKLHPGEIAGWKNRYESLSQSNIEVVDNTNNHLYYYFSIASIQIGVYSTAIYEGLGYNLPTFIIKLPGYEHMNELVSNHYTKLISSPVELIENIFNTTFRPSGTEFWEKQSDKRMEDTLGKIINS